MNKKELAIGVGIGTFCLIGVLVGRPVREQKSITKMEACKQASGAYLFNEERCLQVREIPLQ
jgi:hypothetical protein